MSTPAGTVLVTGALGQVGKRVAQTLLDRGRTVVALDLRTDATEQVMAAFATGAGTLVPAYVDLLDAEAISGLVAEHQPDAIVHLAAVVAPSAYKNPALARRVNVGGTENLVAAALALPEPSLFLLASSAGVYGSRNPHTHTDRLTAATPTNPVDCYGEDKVRAERVLAASGLPYAAYRLGGIISPDALAASGPEYDLLVRAFPTDGRCHAVDARDVALAFANGVDRRDAVDGKVLMIAGNESYALLQTAISDDLMTAVGLGALGTDGLLPGDPSDEDGWGLTDWFDTREAQELLGFQEHDWDETVAWVAAAVPGWQRALARLSGPLARPAMRLGRRRQLKKDGRGAYADPWALVSAAYGPEVLSGHAGSEQQ